MTNFLVGTAIFIGPLLGLDCKAVCKLASKTFELPVEMVVEGEVSPAGGREGES
jgi:hypothetical protein